MFDQERTLEPVLLLTTGGVCQDSVLLLVNKGGEECQAFLLIKESVRSVLFTHGRAGEIVVPPIGLGFRPPLSLSSLYVSVSPFFVHVWVSLFLSLVSISVCLFPIALYF